MELKREKFSSIFSLLRRIVKIKSCFSIEYSIIPRSKYSFLILIFLTLEVRYRIFSLSRSNFKKKTLKLKNKSCLLRKLFRLHYLKFKTWICNYQKKKGSDKDWVSANYRYDVLTSASAFSPPLPVPFNFFCVWLWKMCFVCMSVSIVCADLVWLGLVTSEWCLDVMLSWCGENELKWKIVKSDLI